MDKAVCLQKAGLLLAVAELLKDRVEQLVVPAARLARQDQQLVALTHAVEHDDALLFELGVRVDQALGALAPLRAAVEEQEAPLAAVAWGQCFRHLEQRNDTGGVVIEVVPLALAVFGIKERHDQKQQKKRQRHVRKIQRKSHAERNKKAYRDHKKREQCLI